MKKVKMQRLFGQKTAGCFQRCVGFDGFNAVDSVTYEMDQELGTDYNKRFRAYLDHVQQRDLVLDYIGFSHGAWDRNRTGMVQAPRDFKCEKRYFHWFRPSDTVSHDVSVINRFS